jgi:hypothetical protein
MSDMGSENKIDDVGWYNHDSQDQPLSTSPSMQIHNQQQQHSKFLTLPTVLTLGRVAAVPLLVASTHRFVFFPQCLLVFIITLGLVILFILVNVFEFFMAIWRFLL